MAYTRKRRSYQKKRGASSGGSSYARKRRSYRRAAPRRRAPRMAPRVVVPKYFKAQMNAFDSGGYGVRIPDTNTAPSSAFYCYDEGSVSAVLAKSNAIAFFPNAQKYASTGTAGVGLTWTWNVANWTADTLQTAKSSAVIANYTLARPVAHSVRLTCNGASSATTGFVHIALVSVNTLATTPNASNLPKNVTDMSSLPGYRRVTLSSLTENPLIISNRFLDESAHHNHVSHFPTYSNNYHPK